MMSAARLIMHVSRSLHLVARGYGCASAGIEGRFPFLAPKYRLSATFLCDGYRSHMHLMDSYKKPKKWLRAIMTVCKRHGLSLPEKIRCAPHPAIDGSSCIVSTPRVVMLQVLRLRHEAILHEVHRGKRKSRVRVRGQRLCCEVLLAVPL